MTWARIALCLGVFAVFTLRDDRFFTTNNVFTILEGFAFLGLAALAVGVTIIAGEFDLSVGSAAAVAGIVAVSVVEEIGLIPAVLLTSAIGAAYGAVQGYLVHRLKIQSLVFTLGTLIALRGVAFMISGENTVVMADLADLRRGAPATVDLLAVQPRDDRCLRRHRSVPRLHARSGERSMPSVEAVRKRPRPGSPSCDRSSWPSPCQDRSPPSPAR